MIDNKTNDKLNELIKTIKSAPISTRREITQTLKETFEDMSDGNYLEDPTNLKPIKLFNKKVLVIGDLHAPFIKKGYLEHCKKMYKRWKCDTVVFIGDVIDHHYSSYHETDPNGLGGGEELNRAIRELSKWYKAFPKAYVTIGNHDLIISRKATTSAIPRQWIKEYKDVLMTPKWIFTESLEIDNIVYVHGLGGTAKSKVKNDLQSHVQGHLHAQAYIEFLVGNNERKVFSMQVGCGVDDSTYAMAYGRNFKKSILSCGVVMKGNPYLELM